MSQTQKNIRSHQDPLYNQSRSSYFNIPNTLTVIRLCLVPVLYYIFVYLEVEENFKIGSFIIFTVAMITDYLDGLIARKMHKTTLLGQVLDPMADKLIVTTALVLLLSHQLIAVWIVVILLSRELTINTIKTLASQQGVILSSSWAGKVKTVLQSYAIAFTLLGYYPIFGYKGFTWLDLGLVSFYLSVALSLYSAGEYFVDFIKNTKNTAP